MERGWSPSKFSAPIAPLNKVPKKKKAKKMTLDETNDFGFSIEHSEDLVVSDNRAEKLRDMIMPLLNNLKKNPEADIIRWPNRVEKIDEFIAKMNSLVDMK